MLCVVCGKGIANLADLAFSAHPVHRACDRRAENRVDQGRAKELEQLSAELTRLMDQMAALQKRAVAAMEEIQHWSQPSRPPDRPGPPAPPPPTPPPGPAPPPPGPRDRSKSPTA
jgi:hypothetical protein